MHILHIMKEYRTHVQIIGEILSTARDDVEDEYGSTVTYLMKKTNVPHDRLTKMLNMLTKRGLIDKDQSRPTNRYKINDNGREFLQAYVSFTELAKDYGLSM